MTTTPEMLEFLLAVEAAPGSTSQEHATVIVSAMLYSLVEYHDGYHLTDNGRSVLASHRSPVRPGKC